MPLRFLLRNVACGLGLALALNAANLHAQTTMPPIEVRTPQGNIVPSPAAWRTPDPARLQFHVQGKVKNLPYTTKAQLDWLPQGPRYEASQEVQIPLLGSRRQSSVGAIGPGGLLPDIFIDRSRKEYSTTFDPATKQIRFSRGTEPTTWVRGTQDRLSVFFQVAGMLAAAPKQYPTGTQITVQAASSRRVSPWIFTVRGRETLQLPVGTVQAIKLEHSTASDNDDVQAALWLAPSLQYLPVRIRMLEDGGRDQLDLKLQSHSRP